MFRRAMTRTTRTGSLRNRFALEEPVHGALQAVAERDARLEADHPPRLADVGPRVAHVACARWQELLLDVAPDEVADRVRELEHGRLLTRSDVQHRAARVGCVPGEEVAVDHVLDEREVARLSSVAVDAHRLTRRDRRDE